MTPEQQRHVFKNNLHRLLDLHGAPSSGNGRTHYVHEQFDVSLSTAGKWLIGATMPEISRLPGICSFFGVTYNELLMKDGQQPPSETALIAAGNGYSRLLSSLPDAGDHALVELTNDIEDLQVGNTYLYRVSSDEMEPYVMKGDLAFVQHCDHASDSGVYVFRDKPQRRFYLRRVHHTLGGKTTLFCENARYGKEEVDLFDEDLSKNFYLCGAVVGRLLIGR